MKKTLFIMITIVLTLSFASGTWAAPGDSLDDPIFITTAAELDNVRNGLNKHYKLSNDINLSAYLAPGGAGHAKWGTSGWLPIGDDKRSFTGSLDGNGHVIKGLWINSRTFYTGLFGFTLNATIKNLGVEIDVMGVLSGWRGGILGGRTGGLVGYQDSKEGASVIDNCRVTGNVSSNHNITGGLVGCQNSGSAGASTISNCYAAGNVSGGDAGGLAGTQESESGGISVIVNSCATGDVSGTFSFSISNVGGLVGGQDTKNGVCIIMNCYAIGDVSGASQVGGLVGHQNAADCSIIKCYATGNVSSRSTAGGLVGSFRGKIKNSYAAGNVTSVSEYSGSSAGGLTGYLHNGAITNSYRYAGAIVTKNGIPIDMTDDPNGVHGGVKTAAELMTKTTYTGNSWLFTDSAPTAGPWIWEGDVVGYPKLNMETITPASISAQPSVTAVTKGVAASSISVENGAETNAVSENMRNNFFMEAASNGNLEMLKDLIKSGIDVNTVNKDGETPLMLAAYDNYNSRVIRTFIVAGAYIDDPNSSKNADIIRVMIEAGADVNAVNKYGETPIMLTTGLKISGDFLRETYISKPHFLQVLIENSADVNAVNMKGMTTLMYAAQISLPNNYRFKQKIIQMLVKNGADITIKDNTGRTALDYAKSKRAMKSKVMKSSYRGGNTVTEVVLDEASKRIAIYELLGGKPLSAAETAWEHAVDAIQNTILFIVLPLLLWPIYRAKSNHKKEA